MSYYYKDYGLQSSLKRAKSLGSAKSGAHHWWAVKLTSVALIPITLWLLASILSLVVTQATYNEVVEWVKNPISTILLISFFIVSFYHAALGGQEVIIDYVKDKWVKIPALMLYYFFNFLAGAAGVYAVFYISFQI